MAEAAEIPQAMRCMVAFALLHAGALFADARLQPEDFLEKRVSFGSGQEMTRADFHILSPINTEIRGVLVLCAGQNASGDCYLESRFWLDFAKRERLAMILPHFESRDDDLLARRGYFVADRGSGELLLRAIADQEWSRHPILMFGFSGGAHFAMSFSAHYPGRVLGFSAYSFSGSSTI